MIGALLWVGSSSSPRCCHYRTAVRRVIRSFSTGATRDRLCVGISSSNSSLEDAPTTTTQQQQQQAMVIATALANGISCLDAGRDDGGTEPLADALRQHYSSPLLDDGTPPQTVTVTARIGYRTITSGQRVVSSSSSKFITSSEMEGDVRVEPPAAAPQKNDETNDATTAAASMGQPVAVHNLTSAYIIQALKDCPLIQLRHDWATQDETNAANANGNHLLHRPKMVVRYMAHNPETQGMELQQKGAPPEDIRGFVKERMVDAFCGFETCIAEAADKNGSILLDQFGVCSNGLSLPPTHPLHLPWMDILDAAHTAVQTVHGHDINNNNNHRTSNLSALQFPANLLETNGLDVARQVRAYLSNTSGTTKDQTKMGKSVLTHLPRTMEFVATRPLTCYPDGGMGTSLPFKLVDYQIPIHTLTPTPDSVTEWTHRLASTSSTPPGYTQALNLAMGHFDATELLEKDTDISKLSMEERETLDGCRLLQSMLHDMDQSLEQLRSFAAYEKELYQNVIPLLHDTFEELDEESAAVLQAFFAAHGSAARHAIARNTRTLLKQGGSGIPPHDNIPNDMSLQEYGLRFLLLQKGITQNQDDALLQKVVVGCSKPQHVVEAIQTVDDLHIPKEEQATTTQKDE